MREVERLAWTSSPGRTDWRLRLSRHLAAAQCTRRARRIRVQRGIERIAMSPTLGCRWLLGDGRDDRRLIVRVRLHGRQRGRAGLGIVGRNRAGLGRRRLRTSLKQSQPLLELAVAVLQLLILAGELPKLIFKLLDSNLGVDLVRLWQGLRQAGLRRAETQRRGQSRSARKTMKAE